MIAVILRPQPLLCLLHCPAVGFAHLLYLGHEIIVQLLLGVALQRVDKHRLAEPPWAAQIVVLFAIVD